MRTDFETILVERPEEHVLLLTLNRPEVSNAFNTLMGVELGEFFRAMYVDQEDVRCIVITGAGKKAFCAGGDLKQRNEMTDEQWMRQHAAFEQKTLAMLDCPVPIIAAVNGAAYGGGCEYGAFRADGDAPGHHAGRGRHAEPAAGRWGAPREGNYPDGRTVLGCRGLRVGHGE